MSEISVVATAPSARFALPSDRQYLPGRHVWARIEDGIATVGVTAPLGEVLWYTPEVEYWAVDRIDVGETLATVQGRSSRTVAVGSPVRGTLVELNPLLRRAPHALLAQPYGRGWVARISADRWERDEAGMVSARDYRKILDADLALGREFCFGGALWPAPRHRRRRSRRLGALHARAHDLVVVVEAVDPARLRVGEAALSSSAPSRDDHGVALLGDRVGARALDALSVSPPRTRAAPPAADQRPWAACGSKTTSSAEFASSSSAARSSP